MTTVGKASKCERWHNYSAASSVIWCIIITIPKCRGLKQLFSLTISMVQEFIQGTTGQLCLVHYGWGLSWKLQRLEPGVIWKLVHSQVWHLILPISWVLSLAIGQGHVHTVSPCSSGFRTTWWLCSQSEQAEREREAVRWNHTA